MFGCCNFQPIGGKIAERVFGVEVRTEVDYDQAKTDAEAANILFSYKLSANPDYEDAYYALQFDPGELDVEIGEKKSLFGGFGQTKSEKTSSIRKKAKGGIIVKIVGANKLRKADWIGSSDPYCKCVVEGRPELIFQTDTVKASRHPVWNHEHHMREWEPGNTLDFFIYDEDLLKGHDTLGKARLTADKFTGTGFKGDLTLTETGADEDPEANLQVEIIWPEADGSYKPEDPAPQADQA